MQTFQRSVGLAPKGHIDEQTARALGLIGATWPTVARGTTGAATVRLIETALIGRGIAVRGGVDGVFDVWLEYAVKTFQRQNGLAVSGIVDIATAARLGLTRAPAPGSVWTAVSNGSTGVLVSRAQQALVDHGIAVSSGVTGRFDLPTLYAVQTYQRHHGLLATGVVDVETARSLGLLDPDGNPVATWVDLGLGAAGEPVRTAERCLAAARIRRRRRHRRDLQARRLLRRAVLPALAVGRVAGHRPHRPGVGRPPGHARDPGAVCAAGRPRSPWWRRRPPRPRRHVDDVHDVDDRGGRRRGRRLPRRARPRRPRRPRRRIHRRPARSTEPTTSTTLAAAETTSTAVDTTVPDPASTTTRGSGPDRGDRGAGHDRGRRPSRPRRRPDAAGDHRRRRRATVVETDRAAGGDDRPADHRRHADGGDRRLTTAGRAADTRSRLRPSVAGTVRSLACVHRETSSGRSPSARPHRCATSPCARRG